MFGILIICKKLASPQVTTYGMDGKERDAGLVIAVS
jgi:hypothetical protein